MGRRKTKKIKPSKSNLALKNRRKLDREFHCHFCQHDRDLRSAVGFLSCRICGVTFSTRITSLDEPVDVYTIWIDKCRETDKALTSKDEDRGVKSHEKPAGDTSGARPHLEPTDKRPEPRTRDERPPSADNTLELEGDNLKDEPGVNGYEAEAAEPYTDISYSDIMKTDLPPDYDEDHMYMNISRNAVNQRIIGADEPSGDFEQAAAAGSAVHDLFQDDE